MKNIKQLIRTYPYKSAAVILLLVVLVGAFFVIRAGNGDEVMIETNARTVNTVLVSDYASGAVGFFAPTASGNSFVIRAETGGRVDQTIVSNGTPVSSGQILVLLDGDAELAALTQAEGSYESALSNAEQSGVSVDGAQNNLISAYRSAYTTANDTLVTTIDTFFTRPTIGQTPGLRIDGVTYTNFLNNERLALRSIMEDWQNTTVTIAAEDDLYTLSEQAIATTQRLIDIVDIFSEIINRPGAQDTLDGVSLTSYLSDFSAERSALVGTISTLQTAEESLQRAELSGTGSELSSANAQVKQALGSLQAAQAAYEKTVIRAPFDGVVSSLNVEVGDILNVGSDVVVITPEDTADTVQSFNLPLSAVKYTPTGTFVFSLSAEDVVETIEVEAGLVTTNSVTITGLTGNEIIIEDVRGLKTGDVVTAQ